MITISYINFWKDPYNDSYFTKFIEKNIGKVQLVNHKNNPDILISSCNGNINNIKNINSKCKIFFYGENLNRYPPYNNDDLLIDTFDLIVGFKHTNLSKKQIRFPLWLIYYDYYNYDKNDNILTYIQNCYNINVNKNKNLFSTIISRHDRGGQRKIIWNELEKYGFINSPGSFRNNAKEIGKTQKDKINYISNGIYNICPENSKYEGYCTEKIFQAFEGGTIPLYWGVSFPEIDIINKNKYCFCDIYNKNNLQESIKNVVLNKNKYIDGDLFTENAGDKINSFYSTLFENIKIILDK